MTTEGIEFHEIGTVDVTFDTDGIVTTYHLGRPKLRQWKHFRGQTEKVFNETRDKLTEHGNALRAARQAIIDAADPVLAGVLEKAETELDREDAADINYQVRERAWADVYEDADDDLRAAYDQAKTELEEFAATPFYIRSTELLKEMFAQVGDKLPDDIEEWPAWLATDTTLPGSILTHWQTRPKVSLPRPPN